MPQAVADAVARCLLTTNANLGGYFETTIAAQKVVDDAHAAMADFLGAASTEEIIIGANMTTLTYHMSRTLGRGFKPGDEIIVTRMDHEGNVSPWLQLAEDLGLVAALPAFRRDELAGRGGGAQRHCSRQDAAGRAELCLEPHRLDQPGQGADPARQTGRRAGLCRCRAVRCRMGWSTCRTLGCDFLVCSAYKFFGPHMGILWGRRESSTR